MAARPDLARIALLFGIPTTFAEFQARARDPEWDYGAALLAGRSVEAAFSELYRSVPDAAADLIDTAFKLGVSVYPRARLRDLHEASRRHDVLVIVAHWRGSLVRESDLRPGWQARLQGAADDSPGRQVLRDVQRESPPDMTGASVAASINHVIESRALSRFFPGRLATDMTTHQLIAETLSRDLIDSWFGDTLKPGNQLELWDGLHGVGDVNAAIAADFAGVVDLSCCTSSILGTYVRDERPDAIDVITEDASLVPGPQLRLIEGTLDLLGKSPSLRYGAARRTLSRALGDWYKQQNAG